MDSILGSTFPVFLLVTIFIAGGCAMMTGRALALTWRPYWQAIPYTILLGAADRFLVYALYNGELLLFGPYVFNTLILVVIALASYRFFQVRQMVAQYPWLYQAVGPFVLRELGEHEVQ